MIRKHVDFDTLRSRIISHSIISVKELFRDLLQLANNALVFYSKITREYKSALLLRELTTKTLHQHFNGSQPSSLSSSKAASTKLSPLKTTNRGSPVKPRSVHPGDKNSSRKTANSEAKGVANTPKKGRVGRKNNNRQRSVSPVKGRKKGRTR